MISHRQIRAARALLGWSQLVLAERAGLSPITVKRLEAEDEPVEARASTVVKVRVALEAAGVDFPAPDRRYRDGVRLRREVSANDRAAARSTGRRGPSATR